MADRHARGSSHARVLVGKVFNPKPPLALGDQVRIEARLPISRHIQLYPSGVGNYRLFAVTIAAVAGLAVRKMTVHLRVQRPLSQRFLQIVEQAVALAHKGLRAFVISGNLGLPDAKSRYGLPSDEIERHIRDFINQVSAVG